MLRERALPVLRWAGTGRGAGRQPRAAGHGRAGGGRLYSFESKVLQRAGPGAAMAQLKERGYADKYHHLGGSVHLVSVELSVETRNVAGIEAELASSA